MGRNLVAVKKVGDKNCCQQENSESLSRVFNDLLLWRRIYVKSRKRMVSWGCMTKKNILPA
jgi:hypothetical protein